MFSVKGTEMKKNLLFAVTFLSVLGIASVAVAAGGGGHEVSPEELQKDFIFRIVNTSILFGAIAFFVIKPIKKALKGRSEGIEKALKEAQEAKDAAEAKFAEYDEKLTKASSEIEDIYNSIRKAGEAEKENILTNSQKTAEKIEADAEKAAAREVSKARTELRKEASKLSLELAEDLLKKNVGGADQKRLVDEYLKTVGELH